MSEEWEALFYGLVGVVFAVLVIAGAGVLGSMSGTARDATRYNVKAYGDVLCANLEHTKCGVRLSNCADAMVYECVSDFRYEQKERQ